MTSPLCDHLQRWHSQLSPVMDILRRLAGATEHEFLQLGEQLQDFAQRSAHISSSANELVQLVAGEESSQLTSRLQHLFSKMGDYLQHVRAQGGESCCMLEQIMEQLNLVVQPLEGFQKMDKALRMLSISTKIESARLGELGAGFTTLAMDVEKLSHAVSEKSAGIMGQRLALAQLIDTNLAMVRSTETSQHADARAILDDINAGLQAISQLNEACSTAGSRASAIAEEVAGNTATVVSSMQFHDITRQQIEHVIEALEKLQQHTCTHPADGDKAICEVQAAEMGDTCELQTAQLRHASSQLHQATTTILESLHEIGAKQAEISQELQQALLGSSGSSEHSLLATIQQDMQRVTAILHRCADADQILAQAMHEVTGTIGQIASFVSDIEAVGSEIDLIALNAQIKAAHTGTQGAALGVLAEAIKRLSLDAVVQTEAVTTILHTITSNTEHMNDQNQAGDATSERQVVNLEQEAAQIIAALGHTNKLLHERLASLATTVTSLAEDIHTTTAAFHIHEESGQLAEQAVQVLEQLYSEARQLVPASSEFCNNLHHMEQRYTMESERLIHEMLAARHGGHPTVTHDNTGAPDDSEFGDNVDLF